MKSTVENLANQETELEALDLVEFGDASEETRGGFYGFVSDGGAGRKSF